MPTKQPSKKMCDFCKIVAAETLKKLAAKNIKVSESKVEWSPDEQRFIITIQMAAKEKKKAPPPLSSLEFSTLKKRENIRFSEKKIKVVFKFGSK